MLTFLYLYNAGAEFSVYVHPKLITLEHMITAMYLVRGEITAASLKNKKAVEEEFGDEDIRFYQANMLHLLVSEYVPYLFTLGLAVRQAYWTNQATGTGPLVQKLLSGCFSLLLNLERSFKNEYVRVLAVALTLWSPLHNFVPAGCYVEEALEASLSRLAKRAGTDLRAHTVQHFSDLYVTIGAVDRRKRDLDKPGFSRVLGHRIVLKVNHLVTLIRRGNMAFIAKTQNAVKAKTTLTWPGVGDCRTPERAFGEIRGEYADAAFDHALLTLMKGSTLSEDDEAALQSLCRHVPRVTPEVLASRLACVDACLERCTYRAPRRSLVRDRAESSAVAVVAVPEVTNAVAASETSTSSTSSSSSGTRDSRSTSSEDSTTETGSVATTKASMDTAGYYRPHPPKDPPTPTGSSGSSEGSDSP
jgi:hypothetical protein